MSAHTPPRVRCAPRKIHMCSKGKIPHRTPEGIASGPPAFVGLVPIPAKARGLLSGTVIRCPLTKGLITLSKCKSPINLQGPKMGKARARPKARYDPTNAQAHLSRVLARTPHLRIARASRTPLKQIFDSLEGLSTPRANLRHARGCPLTAGASPVHSTRQGH
jgi:hypothetical protein